MKELIRRRSLTIFGVLWSMVVIAIYYKRLWQIFLLGPLAWLVDNPSLQDFAHAVRVFPYSGIVSVSSLWDASLRAFSALLGAGLVFVASQTLGMGICALIRCQFDNWLEKLIFRAGIGFGTLAYLSLSLAAFTLYRPLTVQILVLGAASVGILLYLFRFRKKGLSLQDLWEANESSRLKFSTWQGIVFVASLIAFIGALAPEIEYDALWYHLWLPQLWLEHGAPVDMVSEYISLYPLSWELVYGAGLALSGPIAAKLLHFSCLLLTGLLMYELVRRYIPQISAGVAVAIWITMPTVLWEATTAYNDLALGFYFLLVIYSVTRFVESGERPWIVVAGISAGFALGIKHLALIALLLVFVGLAIKLWLASRKVSVIIPPLLIFVGFAGTLALPWYIRSWLASHNPVFPELYSLFGATPPHRWSALTNAGLEHFKAHFGRPRTMMNLFLLPWDMTIHSALYGGALGPIPLIFIPLWLLFRRKISLLPWLGGFTLLFIGFWASPISSFQLRFLVPVAPLLAILATTGFEGMRQVGFNNTWGNRLLETGLVALCLLNLPPFISLHEYDRVEWDGWLTHVTYNVPLGVVVGTVSETDYLTQKVPSYAAWQYINAHLASDSRILTFSGGDQYYSYRQRIPSDATMAREAVWVPQRGETDQLFEQLEALGITHILFDKRQLPDLLSLSLAIVQPEVISNSYITEYEDARFILYRVVQEN